MIFHHWSTFTYRTENETRAACRLSHGFAYPLRILPARREKPERKFAPSGQGNGLRDALHEAVTSRATRWNGGGILAPISALHRATLLARGQRRSRPSV